MVRVTRPGGRIVVFDFDWDTLIIDHPDKETTRTVVLTYSDSIQNGWIGRQLPRLFDSLVLPREDRRVECDRETCKRSRLPL